MTEAGPTARRARVTMFCSTGENIGQTTTLINTALLLAESGRAVLIVDARRADIRAFRYLRRSGAGPAATAGGGPARPVECAVPAHGGVLRVDLLTLSGPRGLDDLPGRGGPLSAGGVFAGYDDVLIDAPVARTDAQIGALARLPDLLVSCFTLNSWSIEKAAALARDIRARAVAPVGVLAVGLKADTRMQDQLRIARMRVRAAFDDPADGDGIRYVEIPYAPLYVHSERLAVQVEAPGADDGLRVHLAQLTEELARARPRGIGKATVVHTPRHTAWAEWLTALLESFGVRVTAVPFTGFSGERPRPGTALLVLSPTGADPDRTELLAGLSHPNVRLVLVDELVPPARLSHHEQIDLRHLTEAEAVARLRRGLHLDPSVPVSPPAHRFPSLPARTNVRPRNTGFVGRDEVFGALREALVAAEGAGGHCLLSGEPGIGKSEIALEFCHRFGGGYDAVWWVPARGARGARDVRQALAELTGLGAEPPAGEESPAGGGRTLLVLDDVRDPAVLDGPFPTGTARTHVLVTARPDGATASVHRIEVPPFSAEESRALLSARVPGLLQEQAERVAKTVGDVPLTVRLAASWLEAAVARGIADNRLRGAAIQAAVSRFGEDFRLAQGRLLAKHPVAPLPLVMLEVALASLPDSPGAAAWGRERGGSDALLWLLEACALLAGAGVDLRLMRSEAMLAALARRHPGPAAASADGALGDRLMIDVALWCLARHGLIEVDFDRPTRPLRQHRVLGELIRERMGGRLLAERRAELREVVGAYPPGGPPTGGADTGQWVRYLNVLELWQDDRPRVRDRLLGHLRSLLDAGDSVSLARALEIGGRAEAAWGRDELSPEYLRLLGLLARCLRLQGDYPRAGRYARRALRGHRAVFGPGHPRALLSADAYGAILRAGGHFQEAVVEGRHVVRSMTALLGPHHSATAQTEHNLALSEALTGDFSKALELLQNQFNHRRAIGGEDDPQAWELVHVLAAMHRGLGQNRESYILLKEFLGGRGTPRSGVLSESAVLNAEVGLAVSERRLGRVDGAYERDARVLGGFLAYRGERYIGTLRCRFSLATDLHGMGLHDEAVEETRRCLDGLEAGLGPDHPYAHLCRVRLGVHARAAGRRDTALAEGREARDALEAGLGPAHPWVMAAAAGLAGSLASCGRYEEAEELERFALDGFDALRMTEHPSRDLVARCLADTRARMRGEPVPPEALPRGDIDLELPGV